MFATCCMVGLLSGYLLRLRNSPSLKWGESRVSLIVVFSIDFPCDEFYIVVKSEDAGDEQEGLCYIDQQTVGHIVNHDDLIGHQCDAAHNEQHRTGILRDFESCVFHSRLTFYFLHQTSYIMVASPAAPRRAAMMYPSTCRIVFTVLFIIVVCF